MGGIDENSSISPNFNRDQTSRSNIEIKYRDQTSRSNIEINHRDQSFATLTCLKAVFALTNEISSSRGILE